MKKMNTRSQTLALVASLGLLAACSQTRQLSEMHDSTGEMRDITREMNQQTKVMGQNTEEMKGSTKNMEELTGALSLMTGQLLQVGKQGIGMGLREEILKKIVAATTQVEKLGKAAKYYMAFEFQLWGGIGPETDARREELAASAAREFMREIQSMISESSKQNGVYAISSPEAVEKVKAKIAKESMDEATKIAEARAKELEDELQDRKKDMTPGEISAAKKEIMKARVVTKEDLEKTGSLSVFAAMPAQLSEGANINAFAVALHIQNPIQEDLLRAKPEIKPLSMYSMIKESFLANLEIEGGSKKPEDFPAYVGEIRSFLDVAAVLIKARTNALAFMALTRVSNLLASEDPLTQVTQMQEAEWTLETKAVNSKVLRDTSIFLKGAIEAREFMKKAGIAEDEIGSSKGIFAKAQLSSEMAAAVEAVKTSGSNVSERTAALAELADYIQKYLQ